MKKYYVDYRYAKTAFAVETAEDIVRWLNCGDYDDLDYAIQQTAEDNTIYFDDQWKVMRAYQRPDEADWSEAYCMFLNELYSLVKEIEADEENEDEE